VKEGEKQANVDAGGSQDGGFSVRREVSGRYGVCINGLSGSFTVVAPAAPYGGEVMPKVPGKPPINWRVRGGSND